MSFTSVNCLNIRRQNATVPRLGQHGDGPCEATFGIFSQEPGGERLAFLHGSGRTGCVWQWVGKRRVDGWSASVGKEGCAAGAPDT
jgi:hypothetical protein